MRRVVRRGGRLLLSEPNNLAGMLVADTVLADKPVADWVERVEFALICERGKATLGEGNNSIGDLLPGLLAQAGFVEVQAAINERAWPLVSPYATAEQEALRSMIISMPDDAPWGWPRRTPGGTSLLAGAIPKHLSVVGSFASPSTARSEQISALGGFIRPAVQSIT